MIIPSTAIEALQQCDVNFFPNIHQLLRLACTVPVTSCSVERSNSVLRRLNTYMRASMGEERLTNLALMHCHYHVKYDYNSIIDMFSAKHPRRLELDSILK